MIAFDSLSPTAVAHLKIIPFVRWTRYTFSYYFFSFFFSADNTGNCLEISIRLRHLCWQLNYGNCISVRHISTMVEICAQTNTRTHYQNWDRKRTNSCLFYSICTRRNSLNSSISMNYFDFALLTTFFTIPFNK